MYERVFWGLVISCLAIISAEPVLVAQEIETPGRGGILSPFLALVAVLLVAIGTAARRRRHPKLTPTTASPSAVAKPISESLGPSELVKPAFRWQVNLEFAREFAIGGHFRDVATKKGTFKTGYSTPQGVCCEMPSRIDPEKGGGLIQAGWVVPVSGTLKLSSGGVYRWSLRIQRKNESRPHILFGVMGRDYSPPWRLLSALSCGRCNEDMHWSDRPLGEKVVEVGSVVHFEVDLRRNRGFGTMAVAVNDEPYELVFEDIPLGKTLIPVLLMGGDGSAVKIMPKDTRVR